jgi:hypothetical protein
MHTPTSWKPCGLAEAVAAVGDVSAEWDGVEQLVELHAINATIAVRPNRLPGVATVRDYSKHLVS